jgi:hypothetical protein
MATVPIMICTHQEVFNVTWDAVEAKLKARQAAGSTPFPVFSSRSTTIVSRPLSATGADCPAVMMGDVVAHDHRH